MLCLAPTFSQNLKITQRDIAKSERWLGCHPRHEADIVKNEFETTTRQVRQIINDLRIKYGVPVISDSSGYWLCRSEAEAESYLKRLELEVKATVKSYFTTYKSMRNNLSISLPGLDDYFDDHLLRQEGLNV